MNKEQIIRSRRGFEIAGSFACGFILGCLLWKRSLLSNQEITANDYLTLLVYLLLTSSCYLGAFPLLRRLEPAAAKEINFHWGYASILGTSVSFIADSICVWLRNRPHDLFGFIGFSVILLGIFVVLMFFVMASIIGVGIILRWLKKLMHKNGRKIEARSI